MGKQTMILKCPFCNKGEIEADYFPSILSSRKGSYGGSKPKFERSSSNMIITTEKCPTCGKTANEIKKRIEKGEIQSHEDRVKRLKESGMPTQIGG